MGPKPRNNEYGPWTLDTRILQARATDSERDYFGFIEAPLDEIRLLEIWCRQCLEGAYPITDDGFATLLMDLHRPKGRHTREFLIGRVTPGSSYWRPKPRNISLPNEHQAFK